MREIALWLWTILPADIEYHCLSEATDILEALVVSEEVLILFLLHPALSSVACLRHH